MPIFEAEMEIFIWKRKLAKFADANLKQKSRTLKFAENIESREFIQDYRKRSMVIGKNVTVYKGVYSVAPEKELEGMPAKVLGIDDDGGLEVIYTDGKRETLTSGEISVRL